MRVSKERQEGRIRVSQLKVKILETIESEAIVEDYSELILALLEVTQELQNTLFIRKHP